MRVVVTREGVTDVMTVEIQLKKGIGEGAPWPPPLRGEKRAHHTPGRGGFFFPQTPRGQKKNPPKKEVSNTDAPRSSLFLSPSWSIKKRAAPATRLLPLTTYLDVPGHFLYFHPMYSLNKKHPHPKKGGSKNPNGGRAKVFPSGRSRGCFGKLSGCRTRKRPLGVLSGQESIWRS